MIKGFGRPGVLKGAVTVFCFALVVACSDQSPVEMFRSMVATTAAAPTAAIAPAPPAPAPAPALVDLSGGAVPGLAVHSTLKLDGPIRAGEFAWNEQGAPEGPVKVIVDIAAQRMYVYRGGVEIGRSSILYGADEKPTPLGTFPILEKKVDHVSNIYGAPMPYMLRLTMDGIAIHGSEVDDWSATNGCVGVPDDFARLLFEKVRLGDKILITNNWMTEHYAEQERPQYSV